MHLLVPVSRLVLLVVIRIAASLWRSSHRLHRRLRLLLLERGVFPSHWLGEVLIVLVVLSPLVVAEAAVGALTHLLLLLVLLLDALLGLALHVGQVVLHGLAQGAALNSCGHGSGALDAAR